MYTGELVRLREYREEDIPLAKEYVNKAEIRQYTAIDVPFLYTLYNETKWFEKISPHNGGEYNFAIETLKEQKYIGGCSVAHMDYKNSVVTVGIMIGDTDYLSKGYGADALKVLIKFIFEEMNINKIKLHVYDFNLRAQRCYEKVGFKKECVLKEELFRKGKYHDIIQMSIFKRDYFKEN